LTKLSPPGQGRAISLRARWLLLAALGTASVVGLVTYLQTRTVEEAVEREALDGAGATALGVAADLTERDTLPTSAELEELLAGFVQAEPSVKALTVTRMAGSERAIQASTEDRPPAEMLGLAAQAVQAREMVVSEELPGPVRLVAVPLEREHRPYGAVVVTLSMNAVERVRRQTRLTALLVAPLAIVLLTLINDTLARRLVLRPLARIRETMARASAGDLQARAPGPRADEIGSVVAGLNAMLDRLADFNAALKREVRNATEELRRRNEELMDSSQRLFAARRELARSEQLSVTGQMAASVAHQIGTPLNLISGYVQMILEELPPASLPAARLRTVQEQIGRVTVIVQSLLDQARRPVLERRPIAPVELLSAACELARPTLDAAGIELAFSVEPDLPAVEVDAGQLEQVLLNLVTNSIDAMPQGGRLTVAARGVPGGVEIEIADTGVGIAEENLPHIFDPLFTTKLPGKGTGLGLPIVRDVLAVHGGSVTVASRVGEGTRITVRLPAPVSVPRPASPEEGPRMAATQPSGPRA
jgi:two-component system, NtrC family, sensor kinase